MFVNRRSNPELEPKRTPSITEIAWAAGLYEGEGSVRGYNNRSVMAQMCQKDPEILYRLREMFGGSVNEYANPGMKKTGMVFKWTAGGDKARIFFSLIFPYLSERRTAQVVATTALDFNDGCACSSYEEAKELLNAFYIAKGKESVRGMPMEEKRRYQCDVQRRHRINRGAKPNLKLQEKRDAEKSKVVSIA